MPPRVKITKEDIIKTALELVRGGGEGAINARSIAGALGSSTQPIFSNFSSMEELEKEVGLSAYNLYLTFIEKELAKGEYPPYKSYGMAYIRFAREEKELFKLLFMCDRRGKEKVTTPDYTESVEMIMKTTGIAREKADLMHLEMWTFVHGIGTMLATSFFDIDTELCSRMITDVYQGVKDRLGAKE